MEGFSSEIIEIEAQTQQICINCGGLIQAGAQYVTWTWEVTEPECIDSPYFKDNKGPYECHMHEFCNQFKPDGQWLSVSDQIGYGCVELDWLRGDEELTRLADNTRIDSWEWISPGEWYDEFKKLLKDNLQIEELDCWL